MSDYISEENVVEILKSLPVKSLLRFRCVCKHWKQLIDSPSLAQEHFYLQNQNRKTCLIVDSGDILVSVDPYTTPPTVHTLIRPLEIIAAEARLVGTLHGVVCLFTYDMDGYFLLWNPSTGKLFTLLLPEHVYYWKSSMMKGTTSAFWIDPSTQEFKIVVLDYLLDEVELDYQSVGALYSSAEKSWSQLPQEATGLSFKQDEERSLPLIIEGVAYWIGSEWYIHFTQPIAMFVLGFDFVQERYDVFEAPYSHMPEGVWAVPVLCNWRGSLSIVYSQRCEPHRCDLYLRQDGLWVKMLSFSLLEDISHVFWVWGEMGDERFRAVVKRGDDLVLYHTKDGCVVLRSSYSSDSGAIGNDFVQSLLFPKYTT